MPLLLNGLDSSYNLWMSLQDTNLVNGAQRSIGKFEVGPLGFGCWRFTEATEATARETLETALDLGMNLVDTADVYGLDFGGTGFGANEELLGRLIAESPSLRGRMILATKGGIIPPTPYDSSAEYLNSALTASLKRLAVEHVDLYQVHRQDMYVHPEDLAATLTAMRDSGKIGEVGLSNATPGQEDALQKYLDFPLATSQPQFSLTHLNPMKDGVLDRCMREHVTPLAWSPLAGGSLATGDDLPADLKAEMDKLAERENVGRAAIALAFVLAHPSKPVALLGTQSAKRLEQQAAAVNVTLDRADVYTLIQASEGQPLP